MSKMRVVVDGRPLVKQATGVATCLRDMLRAICEYLSEWELIVVVPKEIHASITGLPLDRLNVVVEPMFKRFNVPNFVWFHMKFPFIAKRLKADVIWGTNSELPIIHMCKSIKLITVHDVVWREYPETMEKSAKYVTIPFLDKSILKADLIHCNSKYTEGKIRHYYPQRKSNNIVVGISCSTLYQRRNITNIKRKALLAEYRLGEKFILFVGSLEPRKNLQFLLKMMPDVYKRTGAKLLVVGGKGWKNHNIHTLVDDNPDIQESVVFANYVDFDKLVDLYNIATVYVSTSLNEGFGLPQLEAMKCGCPVISPHNSAMIEIVYGRGITIKGWDIKEWSDQIVRVVSCNAFRESLCNPDLSDFGWEEIVKRIDAYVKKVVV